MFTKRLVNRLTMPTKHVLIVEDDIEQQRNLLGVFQRLFGHQGHVQVSVVPGGDMAANALTRGGWSAPSLEDGTDTCPKCGYHEAPLKCRAVDLVILDHDLPYGNGPEVLEYMKRWFMACDVITASGIPSNNDALMAAGANHKFTKAQIINGEADDLLRQLLT